MASFLISCRCCCCVVVVVVFFFDSASPAPTSPHINPLLSGAMSAIPNRRLLAREPNDQASKGNQKAATLQQQFVHFSSRMDRQYTGIGATMSVNKPFTNDGEVSMSRIMLQANIDNPDILVSLEAGWEVAPSIYSDAMPHFYIAWTNDGFNQTGCKNLDCPGFVQTNNTWGIGLSFSEVSIPGDIDNQFELPVIIYKDGKDKHWHLNVKGDEVGYWMDDYISNLKKEGDVVIFGGAVDLKSLHPHSSTAMGSGNFSSSNFPWAAYQRKIFTMDKNSNINQVPLGMLTYSSSDESSYNGAFFVDDRNVSTWGSYLFFGGPGGSKYSK